MEGGGAPAPTMISSGEGGSVANSGAATVASARSASPEIVWRGLRGTVIEVENKWRVFAFRTPHISYFVNFLFWSVW